MADINNQTAYWNKVASYKTFTHPIDIDFLKPMVDSHAAILDYGCGYGRLTNELQQAGFTNAVGVDTSSELIERGQAAHPLLDLRTIDSPSTLPVENNSFDLVLLFAVLTCIPENSSQIALLDTLYNKLKPGGLLYISDYYLQENSQEMDSYTTLSDDPMNFGVFTLSEGATFRHHSKKWIEQLLSRFEKLDEKEVEVFTMNGHAAKAFQILVRKQ